MEEVGKQAASAKHSSCVNKTQPWSTVHCRMAVTSCAIHNTLCKMCITNVHEFLSTISMHTSTFGSQQVNKKVTDHFFALCS